MHQKIAAVLSLCLAVYRGDIVTVNDAQPQAEVLAVKDGKILMVGSREQIERSYKGATTTMIISPAKP
jgi:predicted amidohydrolase YtcJ